MVAKKRKGSQSGAAYLVVSTLAMLVILFILYRLYYQQRERSYPFAIEEKAPENVQEAVLVLQQLRKRPDFSYPLVKKDQERLELVDHSFFSLGYHEGHEQAAWVAYVASRIHTRNTSERKNRFRPDPAVSTGSASSKDYTRSGFDRGHLAPAADFDFHKKALSETFYMSNISPQEPTFNRGTWKELEDQVRVWATEKDSLFVVTGPVLSKKLKKIGSNQVSVPKYFYKIILNAQTPQPAIIGFIMPNQKLTTGPGNFMVPVDSIEEISGLDFFPQIPDVLEEALEKEVNVDDWF